MANDNKPKKVISGTVKEKLSLSDKVNGAVDHGIKNVIWPSIKDTAYKFITESVHMFIFGEKTKSQIFSTGGIFTNYANVSNNNSSSLDSKYSGLQEKRGGYRPLIFQSRSDADIILDQLREIAGVYSVVKVSDMYDLIGQTKVGEIQYQKIGWNLEMVLAAKVTYTGDGYVIDLPKPVDISRL